MQPIAEDEEVGQTLHESPEPVELGASLSDRMEARASELEKQQSEWFPIPGYDGIVEVELRALGYKTIRSAQRRNERIRDLDVQELYNIADQLVTATLGFRMMPERLVVDDDWLRLAQRRRDCPDNLSTPRQALLWLVGDQRIAFLAEAWGRWARSVRTDVDEEVGKDFE